MTVHPIVSPLVLAMLAAVVVGARLNALRAAWPRRTRSTVWRWVGLTAAALLLLCAAARPTLGDVTAAPAGVDDDQPNVFLVVDRSPGMGVRDAAGRRSRIDAARADIGAVLDRYPRARVAVIGFATGPSVEWPLSQDTWSLRPALAELRPVASTPDDVVQTNVAAAGTVLRYQLISAQQQFPRAHNLVFYFGAGAAESQAPQRDFDPPEGAIDGGAVYGYGTAAGGPIPQAPDVSSTVNEAALRDVATQLGVPYVPPGGAGDAVPVDAGAPRDAPPSASRPTELYWVPAGLAAMLLLVELYLVLRDVRRARSTPAEVPA